MKTIKTILRIGGILVCTFLFFSDLALAQQEYPTKPISMIHGFAVGGGTDVTVRLLGECLSQRLNQPVITVPKPGASAMNAAIAIARAVPDGYTIGHMSNQNFVMAPYLIDVPYKLEDFKFILGWHWPPALLVCRSDTPYKNLKDVVEAAKTKNITFGHNSKAGAGYMNPAVFAKDAGIKLVDVPFKGDGDQIPALLGGHIDLGSIILGGPATSLLEEGKIRALVVFGKTRSSYLPEVPTFSEQGFKVPIASSMLSMLVTAKTPDAIVGKLHNAMIQCVNDPKLKAEFAKFKVDLIQIESKEWIENILREREYVYPILKDLGLAK